MSRAYRMRVQIEGYDPSKMVDIAEAVLCELGSDDGHDEYDYKYNKALTFHADTQLCGGESEEEFFARVRDAVWHANGDKYCSVIVHQTYMEDLPTEMYETSEEDFDDYEAPEAGED